MMSNSVRKETQKQELNILPLLTIVPVLTFLVLGAPMFVSWLS